MPLTNIQFHSTPSLLGDNSQAASRKRHCSCHTFTAPDLFAQAPVWRLNLPIKVIIEKKHLLSWILLGSKAKLWLWELCCCVIDCRNHPCRRWRNEPLPVCLNQINVSTACSTHFRCRCNPGSWRGCSYVFTLWPLLIWPPHLSPLNKGTEDLFFLSNWSI